MYLPEMFNAALRGPQKCCRQWGVLAYKRLALSLKNRYSRPLNGDVGLESQNENLGGVRRGGSE